MFSGLEQNLKYDVRVLAGTVMGFPTLKDEHWPWISQITDPTRSVGSEDCLTLISLHLVFAI